MKRVTRWGWWAYGVAIAVVAADQAAKAWIVDGLRLGPGFSRAVWGPLRLTLVENRGVSFGLFQSDAPWTRWALAAFSLAVAGFLAAWVRRTERPYVALCIGLIMGGALGNLVDRVRSGSVVDFVDVQQLFFPWIFNLADSAISVGIVLLLAEALFSPRKAAA